MFSAEDIQKVIGECTQKIIANAYCVRGAAKVILGDSNSYLPKCIPFNWIITRNTAMNPDRSQNITITSRFRFLYQTKEHKS